MVGRGGDDWNAVLATLAPAGKRLEEASAALAAAHQSVASRKDRSAKELDLLREEVDDIAGRFKGLREALEEQRGPEPVKKS
jgi:hypothetical protein